MHPLQSMLTPCLFQCGNLLNYSTLGGKSGKQQPCPPAHLWFYAPKCAQLATGYPYSFQTLFRLPLLIPTARVELILGRGFRQTCTGELYSRTREGRPAAEHTLARPGFDWSCKQEPGSSQVPFGLICATLTRLFLPGSDFSEISTELTS